MPIVALWETERGRLQVEAQPRQLSESLAQKIKIVGNVAQFKEFSSQVLPKAKQKIICNH